jgi:hypothetical protein
MKAYSYVIATDAGSAPNFEPPAATLAVCKPKIRKSAHVGDLVVAFAGRRLGPEPHAVRWAGVVSEKLLFSEYWNDDRFEGKKPRASLVPDNIYRLVHGRLIQVPNSTHPPAATEKDISGMYVLVLDPAWYFGSAGAILPAAFGLRLPENARRGHRVNDLSDSEWKTLRRWLNYTRRSMASPSNERPLGPHIKPTRTRSC